MAEQDSDAIAVSTTARLSRHAADTFPWGVDTGATVPADVELRWDPTDPLAVRLTFRTGGPWVSWWLSRELLATGLLMPAGIGDVHLRPYVGVVAVHLRDNLRREIWALLDTEQVTGFLEETYRRIPLGREGVDIGAEWEALR